MKNLQNNREDGFSLIELVVAIAVILVLTVGGLIGFGKHQANARLAMVEAAAQQTAKGALAYETGGTGSAEDAVEAYNGSAKTDSVKVSLDRRDNGCMRFVATYTGHDEEAVRSINCGTDEDLSNDDGSDNDNSRFCKNDDGYIRALEQYEAKLTFAQERDAFLSRSESNTLEKWNEHYAHRLTGEGIMVVEFVSTSKCKQVGVDGVKMTAVSQDESGHSIDGEILGNNVWFYDAKPTTYKIEVSGADILSNPTKSTIIKVGEDGLFSDSRGAFHAPYFMVLDK